MKLKVANKIEIKEPVYKNKIDESNFMTSPFDDYNKRGDCVQELLNNGWQFVFERGDNTHFKRPGSTDSRVSGNFSRKHNRFYVFSTSIALMFRFLLNIVIKDLMISFLISEILFTSFMSIGILQFSTYDKREDRIEFTRIKYFYWFGLYISEILCYHILSSSMLLGL